MAKDGTMRGGPRPNSGRPKKPLADRIMDGELSKATIVELPGAADLIGEDMPPVAAYMKAEQHNGTEYTAAQIYEETWQWLTERSCAHLINPQLLQKYAVSTARWIQCDVALSRYGLLAKHPTTQSPIASPYIAAQDTFFKQSQATWNEIEGIVKENCTVPYQGSPQQDKMEMLLQRKKG